MPEELLRANLLTICLIGGLMALVGLALYVARASIGGYTRFFLPLPPLGVAAYVFSFNYFRDVAQPTTMARMLKEVFRASMVAMGAFFCFSMILILVISSLRQSSRGVG